MCMTVTVMALENSRIHCKQSAIQWFHSSAVAKLLISSAKLTFTISDERNTYSAWKLLSMALKTKEKSSSGCYLPLFLIFLRTNLHMIYLFRSFDSKGAFSCCYGFINWKPKSKTAR